MSSLHAFVGAMLLSVSLGSSSTHATDQIQGSTKVRSAKCLENEGLYTCKVGKAQVMVDTIDGFLLVENGFFSEVFRGIEKSLKGQIINFVHITPNVLKDRKGRRGFIVKIDLEKQEITLSTHYLVIQREGEVPSFFPLGSEYYDRAQEKAGKIFLDLQRSSPL